MEQLPEEEIQRLTKLELSAMKRHSSACYEYLKEIGAKPEVLNSIQAVIFTIENIRS